MYEARYFVQRSIQYGEIAGYTCAIPGCGRWITCGFGNAHQSYKKVICHMSVDHFDWWYENWMYVRIQEPGSDKWITRHHVSGRGDQSPEPEEE